jgi:NAD(P)-dependent dehydrogenase (short-subunit alcohol dehydrogenase family)
LGERVAVVTGGGSGIGRACAIALSDDFTVVVMGRRPAALEETVRLCGRPAHAVVCDVTRRDSVRDAFRMIEEQFGRLDLLFNNAGTGAPGTVLLEDLAFEQWQSVVDTNLTGAFSCMQEAFRIMKAQEPRGGRIINNGSISAHAPRPNSAPYTATKHGMTGLTRAGALDGRRFGIAVGQIDIGNAATEMTEAMKTGMPQANGAVAPEPTMDVAHAAAAVRFMASLPLEANVQFMTIMATGMPFIGRG